MDALVEAISTMRAFHAYSKRAQLLVLLYHARKLARSEMSYPDIQKAFLGANLKAPAREEVNAFCEGENSPVLKIGKSYALSVHGEREVAAALPQSSSAREELEKLLGKLTDEAERSFFAEAVACTAVGANRAAIVLTWILAVDHLRTYVLRARLSDFNKALLTRTDLKGLQVSSRDDFLKLKDENQFVELLRSADVITKDVRKILDEALGVRNTCGHPNDIKVSSSKVASVIEDLVENVILKYPLQ